MRETVSLLRVSLSKQIGVKRKTREAGGRLPGWGTTEGGRGKLSVDLRCHLANLAKLFIGEEGFFLISGALFVAESRLFRDAAEFSFRNTEQRCRAFLRDVA